MLFVLSLLIIHTHNGFTAWDLIISGANCTVSMELISIPFEGRNNLGIPPNTNNRLYEMYNGGTYRYFSAPPNTNHTDYNLTFKTQQADQIKAASCYYEAVDQLNDPMVYGYGKFLITITPNIDPSKKISFYFNNLDSKFGTDNYHNIYYHDDLSVIYFL